MAKKNKKFRLLLLVVAIILLVAYVYVNRATVIPEAKAYVSAVFSEVEGAVFDVVGDINSDLSEEDSSEETVSSRDSSQSHDSVQSQNVSESNSSNDSNVSSSKKSISKNDSYAQSNLEIPLCKGTVSHKNGDDHEVHTYKGFELCYRESYEDAEWVAYTLTREELNGVTGRSNDFRPDPSITTGSSVLADYKGSGYDRGHLAPAADMEWSNETVSESFFMSNMTPQAPDFNRGMWKDLESAVRDWARKFGSVTVVTGPVLEKPASEYPSIGKNNVAVPEYFYKALLAKKPDGSITGIGFIMPNAKCKGSIYDYAVPVDEVERRTGLDFFSALSDSIEEELESEFALDEWK